MPRPPESPFRRFMMQAIMWIILGGTIGLAALVDRQKARKLDAPLGDYTTLDDGISLRLPRGWIYDTEIDNDSETLIVASDPQYRRLVSVELHQLSLSSLWARRTVRRTVFVGRIPFGDGVGELRSRVDKTSKDEDIFLYSASASLTRGRTINISLRVYGAPDPAELEREKNLIKRIAASVKFPADMEIAPATQPQPEADLVQ